MQFIDFVGKTVSGSVSLKSKLQLRYDCLVEDYFKSDIWDRYRSIKSVLNLNDSEMLFVLLGESLYFSHRLNDVFNA